MTAAPIARRAPQRSRRRIEPDPWRKQANCLGVGPDLFFPGQGEPTEPAKAVCRGCRVRGECLAAAMTTPRERHGIWGGLSERERRRLRRQQLRAALAERRNREAVA